jgi:hypothetical protein
MKHCHSWYQGLNQSSNKPQAKELPVALFWACHRITWKQEQRNQNAQAECLGLYR